MSSSSSDPEVVRGFWEEWVAIRPLECGGFSEVFLVCNQDACELAILKWLTAPNEDERRNEITSYQKLRKLSLISRCDVARQVPHPYHSNKHADAIILDYHSGPDLFQWLSSEHSNAEQCVQEPEFLWSCLKSCSSELLKLHLEGFTHGDVKPENLILLSQSIAGTHRPYSAEIDLPVRIKLIDFGFTQESSLPLQGTYIGTVGYTPPEWLPGRIDPFAAVDNSLDIYALGSVMYSMMQASSAYDQLPSGRLQFQDIKKSFYEADLELEDLVRQMLSLEPTKRPSCSAILRIIDLRK
jgi:serine/threonine protein kinase